MEGLIVEITVGTLAQSITASLVNWNTHIAYDAPDCLRILANMATFNKVNDRKVEQYCRTQKETLDLAIHDAEGSQTLALRSSITPSDRATISRRDCTEP